MLEAYPIGWEDFHPYMWNGEYWAREDGSFILANYLVLPEEDPAVNHVIHRYGLVQGTQPLQTEIERTGSIGSMILHYW